MADRSTHGHKATGYSFLGDKLCFLSMLGHPGLPAGAPPPMQLLHKLVNPIDYPP